VEHFSGIVSDVVGPTGSVRRERLVNLLPESRDGLALAKSRSQSIAAAAKGTAERSIGQHLPSFGSLMTSIPDNFNVWSLALEDRVSVDLLEACCEHRKTRCRPERGRIGRSCRALWRK
jgi:hypothetical protein